MTQINAYLSFNGNCREAMLFYQRCLGGELSIQTIAETPLAAQCPAGMQHQVMHSMLAGIDWVLMGSDMVGKDGFGIGADITLSINNDNATEIKSIFKSLSEGGKVYEDLTEKPWGALFGALTDKFGKRWMFNSDLKK
ncbi:MAG: VOC family protein [Agriterribacter sp.]